jgi:lysine 6-dehydrogenase
VKVKVRCGGIPQDPKGVLGYRWAFSTAGLITEYTQKTNILRGGVSLHVDSMTEPETLYVDGLGDGLTELEAAFTGGNSGTMIATLVDKGFQGDFDYKTLRYPGHWQRMREFQELDLFDSKEFIQRLERYLLQYKDDPDALVLRVSAQNERCIVTAEIVDKQDPVTGLTAMQRTTGFSASIILQMLVREQVTDTGVLRQETSVPYDLFLDEWARRGIHVNISRRERAQTRT